MPGDLHKAAGQPGVQLRMTVFVVKAYTGKLEPSGEIEELAWLSAANPDNLQIGSIFEHEVIPRLHRVGLIE